jgi:hypothetical protein
MKSWSKWYSNHPSSISSGRIHLILQHMMRFCSSCQPLAFLALGSAVHLPMPNSNHSWCQFLQAVAVPTFGFPGSGLCCSTPSYANLQSKLVSILMQAVAMPSDASQWSGLLFCSACLGRARVHLWVTWIHTHGYFKFKMLYLDLCGFQSLGDSELWVKNPQVLGSTYKYSAY